jgi:integrase
MPRLETTFTPYIFSKEEVNAIFSACDNLKSGNNDMRSSVFIMPALCRTLYGTGIRIGEALSLVNKDVNLQDNYFILRDTKNGKVRMVPFSTSLSEILKEYTCYRAKLPVHISEETPFFVTLQGTICNRDSIYRRFCKVLALANIPKGQIRLHDIRHSMACHALAQMVEEGMDLYTSLPILSTYLGHQSIRATNTYVRLTADMYPDIIRKIELISFNVFPKL